MGTLPKPLTRLHGRDRALASLAQIVTTQRLVTLVGPGGVGKTRLAVALLSGQLELGGAEVSWVDLSRCTKPDDVHGLIAAALEADDAPPTASGPGATTRRVLGIDNCEHVLDHSAAAVADVLGTRDDVWILATSRTPLGIMGERLFEVRPLATEEAVALFNERSGGSVADPSDLHVLAALCDRVDGLPLAIELAAARTRHLSVAEILDQIGQVAVLSAGPREAPARQQTMEASIRWGYDLLGAHEQLVLARLSVFAAGFTRNAVEACLWDPIPADLDGLSVITALVDHSFLAADTDGPRTRYRMLAPIRDFAIARLAEAGAADQMRDRHLARFERVARDAQGQLLVGDYELAFETLTDDLDNLRSAMDWALESDRPQQALTLGVAAVPFWTFGRRVDEIHSRLRVALDAVDPSADAYSLCTGLLSAGFTTMLRGDLRSARQLLEKSRVVSADAGIELVEGVAAVLENVAALWSGAGRVHVERIDAGTARAQELGHSFIEATSLHYRGTGTALIDRLSTARPYFDAAREIGTRDGLPAIQAWACGFQALVEALPSGDLQRTRQLIDEAEQSASALGFEAGRTLLRSVEAIAAIHLGDDAVARAILDEIAVRRDRVGVESFDSYVLALGGWCHWALGEYDDAAAAADVAVVRLRSSEHVWMLSWALQASGLAALAHGRVSDARARLEECLTCTTAAGFHVERARALLALGHLERAEGDTASAARRARHALELARDNEHLLIVPELLDLLAFLAFDDDDRARRLVGAAAALRDEQGTRALPGLTSWLGAQRTGPAWDPSDPTIAEGREMHVDDAVSFALRGTGANRVATTGWDSLTPTEARVVELALDGLSNKELASRLVVSVNTIKTHIASVYVKLDVSSRSALAASAREHAGN